MQKQSTQRKNRISRLNMVKKHLRDKECEEDHDVNKMFSPLSKVTPIKQTVLDSINKESMSNLSEEKMKKILLNSPNIEGKMKKIQFNAIKNQ